MLYLRYMRDSIGELKITWWSAGHRLQAPFLDHILFIV